MPEWLEIAIVRFHYEAAWWQWSVAPWDQHAMRHHIMTIFRNRLEHHYCVSTDPRTIDPLYESGVPIRRVVQALNASWRFLQDQARAYGADAEDALNWARNDAGGR